MSFGDLIPIILAFVVVIWFSRFVWKRWGMKGVLGPFYYSFYEAYQEGRLKFPFATAAIVLALFTTYSIEPSPDKMIVPHSPFYGWILTSDNIALSPLIWAQFSHFNIFHLYNNLAALILFGSMLEIWIGWRRYILIYFIAGTLGLAVGTAFVSKGAIVIGASGNVSAVIGAYIIRRSFKERARDAKYRWLRLTLMIFFISIYLFGSDLWGVGKESEVAHSVHLFGALAGILVELYYEWRDRKAKKNSAAA